jgi:hypothetical protein
LRLGQTCNLVLLPNTSTTLVAKEKQICVQMVGQQKTAGTIVSPVATYGQATDGQQEFGPPEILFGLALGATAAGFAFDDKDEAAPPVSQ